MPAPQGARWNFDIPPAVPRPGKYSLHTDVSHFVLGVDDGFSRPLPGASLVPDVHVVSAQPELGKLNSVIIPP